MPAGSLLVVLAKASAHEGGAHTCGAREPVLFMLALDPMGL